MQTQLYGLGSKLTGENVLRMKASRIFNQPHGVSIKSAQQMVWNVVSYAHQGID